ncbi:alpha/beta hydrolase [Streptomyces mutabilis]|uniref:alpha/beta fold hydrolase n=1 Tax=Streptomyces mutabilis TaxID=67332 RepID=UPI0033ADC52A
MTLTAENTSHFVELPSGRMHYHEAGSGHPLILVHGSGAGASGWSNFSPNIEALAEHFHVFAVDVIGWGESDAVKDGEFVGPVQIIEFMDALGLDKAALVGNSMGGVISIAAAARHPERISHLITMGPGVFTNIPPLFTAGDGPTEGIKILLQAYLDPSVETMKKLVSIMAFDPAMASDAIATERARATLARPDHIGNALQGFKSGKLTGYQATPAEAAGITAPSLLIHGRDDRVVPYEHTLRLVATIPNSRAVLLNRCGHWAQLEHADEFNRLVVDFVTNN